MSDLAELFPFLSDQRSDVRKMASQGLAQISKDNKELFKFLADSANAAHLGRLVDLVDPRLPAAAVPTLGDALLTIVNVSIDLGVCDALVARKAPTKLLKLYETLAGKSNEELPSAAALGELTLMALNNLTATSVSACEQVLELEDEDLAGYSFGRLKTHLDRCPEISVLDNDEGKNAPVAPAAKKSGGDDDDEDAKKPAIEDVEEPSKKHASSNSTVTHRKWILQIALNVCRTQDGTRLFLEDDDWTALPAALVLTSEHAYTRALGMQLLRNLANFRDVHAALVDKAKVVGALLKAVCVHEVDATLLHGWVDIIVQLITTEDGMRGMDQVNAKRLLVAAVKESTEMHRRADGDSGKSGASAASAVVAVAAAAPAAASSADASPLRRVPLPWDVIKRINEEIVPFLDDIHEMYVRGPGDEDDE